MTVEVREILPGVSVFRAPARPVNDEGIGSIVLLAMVHGNEVVGDAVLRRFVAEAHDRLIAGEVRIARANLAAMEQNVRHTADGQDMNRLWHRAQLEAFAQMDDATAAHMDAECQRVRELAPVLRTADLVFDLHSTSERSDTHLVMRDDLVHARLAGRMGVRKLVTGVHEGAVLQGGIASAMGLDQGQAWSAEMAGSVPRVGFTLEAGQHLDPDNLESAWGVVARLLVGLGFWKGPAPAAEPGERVTYEVQDRVRQVPEGYTPWTFALPVERIASFEPVQADEVVLTRGSHRVQRAAAPFTILMPAPTAGPNADLYYTTRRRRMDVMDRPTTAHAARAEAAAVERVLDILGDDEAERGTLRVAFDARRVLDTCAEILQRVVRLPADDPHRRITVVGRGDWGGDEIEHRAGQRYRQAVEDALAAGVPVERVQLLRGASLGYLQSLLDGAARQLRLRLSADQPHTVALLVAGDLELALATGITRHLRVALVVEAATLVPDEDRLRSQISRVAVFGSRLELLRIAHTLVGDLAREHDALVVELGLNDPELLHEDGALRIASDAAAARVRAALLGFQVDRWRQRLRSAVLRNQTIPAEALGVELRRVSVRTGILDGAAVRALIARPTEDGSAWTMGPEVLDRVKVEGWRTAYAVAAPRPVPHQVSSAAEVDHDNLARWLGWKRYLQESDLVPGSRGRRMDVTLNMVEVQTRITEWYRDAVRLARNDSKRWRLVVAGDGLRADRATDAGDASLAEAHDAALLCPDLAYLRIQHAQGSSLPWLKRVASLLGRRPRGREDVQIVWEAEHGGTVNVILLASAPRTAPGVQGADETSLEGWTVERCAVVLSDLAGQRDNAHRLGLSTGTDRGDGLQSELIHFGRVHCQRLMRQATTRATGAGGMALRQAFQQAIVDRVSRWIDILRAEGLTHGSPAAAATALGVIEPSLAQDIALAAAAPNPDSRALAAELWAGVPAWSDLVLTRRAGGDGGSPMQPLG